MTDLCFWAFYKFSFALRMPFLCILLKISSPIAMVRMFVSLQNPYLENLIPKVDGIRRWKPLGNDQAMRVVPS